MTQTEEESLRSSVRKMISNATFGIFPWEETLAAMLRRRLEFWDDFMGFVLLEYLSAYVSLSKNTKQRADLQDVLYIFLRSYNEVARESVNEFMQKTAQESNSQHPKQPIPSAATEQDALSIGYILSTHFKFAWLFIRLQEEGCVQDEAFLRHQEILVNLGARAFLAKSHLPWLLQEKVEKLRRGASA